ncbi:hypothetical protein NW062_07090 [Mycoplasmopsis cynos]|nr:hypothetical protein NW062_07090 [Mycoplasmopsis cynos]
MVILVKVMTQKIIQDENKGEAGKNDSKQEDKPAPTPQLPDQKLQLKQNQWNY